MCDDFPTKCGCWDPAVQILSTVFTTYDGAPGTPAHKALDVSPCCHWAAIPEQLKSTELISPLESLSSTQASTSSSHKKEELSMILANRHPPPLSCDGCPSPSDVIPSGYRISTSLTRKIITHIVIYDHIWIFLSGLWWVFKLLASLE